MPSKTPEAAARLALNSILATSIRERAEYGGMIYMERGAYSATAARSQGYGNTVDVGLREDNKGCPEGTIPVAYYHTHPNVSVGSLPMAYNEFRDDDVAITQDHRIDGYLGTVDGSFFKFDFKNKKLSRLPGRLKNTGR
jgi:hypothetical protein